MPYEEPKINGISFVASPNQVEQQHIAPVLNVNANFAAVMPFGFIRNLGILKFFITQIVNGLVKPCKEHNSILRSYMRITSV